MKRQVYSLLPLKTGACLGSIAMCLTSCRQRQLLHVDLIPNSEVTILQIQASEAHDSLHRSLFPSSFFLPC